MNRKLINKIIQDRLDLRHSIFVFLDDVFNDLPGVYSITIKIEKDFSSSPYHRKSIHKINQKYLNTIIQEITQENILPPYIKKLKKIEFISNTAFLICDVLDLKDEGEYEIIKINNNFRIKTPLKFNSEFLILD